MSFLRYRDLTIVNWEYVSLRGAYLYGAGIIGRFSFFHVPPHASFCRSGGHIDTRCPTAHVIITSLLSTEEYPSMKPLVLVLLDTFRTFLYSCATLGFSVMKIVFPFDWATLYPLFSWIPHWGIICFFLRLALWMKLPYGSTPTLRCWFSEIFFIVDFGVCVIIAIVKFEFLIYLF